MQFFNRSLTLICLLLLLLIASDVYAQQPSSIQQAQIRSELKKRDLSEEEVRARFIQEGFDVDNMSPEELLANKDAMLAILDQMEKDKKAGKSNAPAGTGPAPIVVSPSGQQGSVLEEATTPAEAMADAAELIVQQKSDNEGIYGHSLFTNKSLEIFRTTDGAKAPDTYVLGAGDQVRVSIFGVSQADLLLEINSEGFIQPSGLPKIYLQGVTMKDARKLLIQRFSGFYRFQPDQFSLSIQTARTITLNVFGEVAVKGSFTVSALNTAFNALAAAGGPTRLGSVREIQLIRGKQKRTIDVYAFLNDPSVQFQYDLQHNDILFVPIAAKIVTLNGAVKRPMKYEMSGKEDLRDLIKYAGGLNFDTYPDYVQIERVEKDSIVLKEWKLSDVLEGRTKVSLQDGDVIRIREISRRLENFVEIEGSVFFPGRFDLSKHKTLAELLKSAQLTPESKLDAVFIERKYRDGTEQIIKVDGTQAANFDTVLLEARDRVVIYNKARYINQSTLEVVGAVRNPFSKSLGMGDALNIEDALAFAGGLLPSASSIAYIRRADIFNPELVEYIRIDLSAVGNLSLKAGDRLNIYDNRTFTDVDRLRVTGAIRNPVNLNFSNQLTLPDVLTMAGGFTRSAAKNRIDIFRLRIDPRNGTGYDRIVIETDSNFRMLNAPAGFRLEPYDQIVVRDIPLFDLDRNLQISGQVMYPGVYSLSNRRIHLSELIANAGGLTQLADINNAILIRSYDNKGAVGINLRKALINKGKEKFDPVLMEGDVITISQFQNTVGIRLQATRLGELRASNLTTINQNPNEVADFVYQGKKSARWYVRNFAGGFGEKADKKSVTVTYPDGRAKSTRTYFFFIKDYPTVMPNSTVALNYKIEKPIEERKKVDWEGVYTKTIQTTTTLLTLMLLINRL